MSFIAFFCLLVLNLYILLSLDRVAVDSDDLTVFSSFSFQVTAPNYIFRVSVYVAHTNFYFCVAFDE